MVNSSATHPAREMLPPLRPQWAQDSGEIQSSFSSRNSKHSWLGSPPHVFHVIYSSESKLLFFSVTSGPYTYSVPFILFCGHGLFVSSTGTWAPRGQGCCSPHFASTAPRIQQSLAYRRRSIWLVNRLILHSRETSSLNKGEKQSSMKCFAEQLCLYFKMAIIFETVMKLSYFP